jgi:hypothetical protein
MVRRRLAYHAPPTRQLLPRAKALDISLFPKKSYFDDPSICCQIASQPTTMQVPSWNFLPSIGKGCIIGFGHVAHATCTLSQLSDIVSCVMARSQVTSAFFPHPPCRLSRNNSSGTRHIVPSHWLSFPFPFAATCGPLRTAYILQVKNGVVRTGDLAPPSRRLKART